MARLTSGLRCTAPSNEQVVLEGPESPRQIWATEHHRQVRTLQGYTSSPSVVMTLR